MEKAFFLSGLPTMHEIRSKISKIGKDPKKVLSPYTYHKYDKYEFWRNS